MSIPQRNQLRAEARQLLRDGDSRGAVLSGSAAYKITYDLLGPAHQEGLPECLLLAKAHARLNENGEAAHYLTMAQSAALSNPYVAFRRSLPHVRMGTRALSRAPPVLVDPLWCPLPEPFSALRTPPPCPRNGLLPTAPCTVGTPLPPPPYLSP